MYFQLEPHKNLVDQCVQGEGLVQINIEIKRDGNTKKINIVDVLKPTDEFLEHRKYSDWYSYQKNYSVSYESQ